MSNESKKFTAIYTDSWHAGSMRYTSTKMRRFEQRPGESLAATLKREDIADSCVYIFVGHPDLEGEKGKTA